MLTIERMRAFGANVDEGLGRCMGREDFYLRLVKMARADANMEKLSRAASDLKSRLAEAERKANRLASRELTEQFRKAESAGDLKGITLAAVTVEDMDPRAVSAAVSDYIAEKGKLLLLAAGERLTFARSEDVPVDMAELIRRVGRGGGRSELASGAGIPECVNVARKILITEMK